MQEKQKENCAAEVQKAVEMRQLSMETLAESKKKKSQSKNGEKSTRRMSSTSTETSAYLQKKWEVDVELKKEELRLRQLEADEWRQQQNNMTSQHEAVTKALTDSIAAQQREQEQMMDQMQLQNTALLSLMQCITKKD